MPPRRKIEEYDSDGNFIKVYPSIVSILKKYNLTLSSGSRITQAIRDNKPFKNNFYKYVAYNQKKDEIFKYLPDYELEISNYGTARMKNGYTTNGSKIGDYYRLCLGRRGNPAIHVLVAKAFIPNNENKPTVNHKVKVRHGGTNHVSNLEWATHKEQCIHRDKDLPL